MTKCLNMKIFVLAIEITEVIKVKKNNPRLSQNIGRYIDN